MGLERFVSLLDGAIRYVGFADDDDWAEVVARAPELSDLLSRECHGARP